MPWEKTLFRQSHPRTKNKDGTPFIANYAQAFTYLGGASKLNIENAIALQLFHQDTRDYIAKFEKKYNKTMTEAEIDHYIETSVRAVDLDVLKGEARRQLQVYVTRHAERSALMSIFPLQGAWAGFCGNMLTIIVGLCVVAVLYANAGSSAIRGMAEFYDRCIAMVGVIQ